jgi:nitrogen fixation protein NifU and related proteins
MSIYQDIILDHYRNPRNFGHLDHATHESEAKNLSCGDRLEMTVSVKKGVVDDIRFQGEGCAISQAAASMLTEYAKGKPAETLLALEPKSVLELLTLELSPTRMKCALLSLETLKKTLRQKTNDVR